jgi:hypothetical protein
MICSCLLSDRYRYFNNFTIGKIHIELLQLSKRLPDFVSIVTYSLFLDSSFFSCFTFFLVSLSKFCVRHSLPQSIQSASHSFQSSKLGPPAPSSHPPGSVAPRPFGSNGGDTHACRGGGEGTQFRRLDRNSDTHHLFCISSQTFCSTALSPNL